MYWEQAIDLDGPEVETIAAATAATGIFAVIGCIERRDGDEAERLMRKHIAQTKERLARMLREEVALNAA